MFDRTKVVSKPVIPGIAAVVCALVLGCDSKPATNGSGTTVNTNVSLKPSVVNNNPTTSQPRGEANNLLDLISKGTAKPEQFTERFLSLIAPPTSQAEKTAGYSATDLSIWLSRFEKAKFVVNEENTFAKTIALHGRVELPSGKSAFTVHVTQGAKGYQISWLHRSDRMASEVKLPSGDTSIEVFEISRCFLDLTFGGDRLQAQQLMSNSFKEREGGAPTAADMAVGRTYDFGFLNQKMASWGRGVTGYSITLVTIDATGKQATAAIKLYQEGGNSDATIQLEKPAESWLVSNFKK
ncbi:MAG: hypothetical protein R3B84_06980 [Zavarzinella sp.]